MLKRKLSMAWEQWQFWYQEKMHQAFLMAGVIKRMLNRKLSQAWEQWQFWYEEYVRQQALIKRGLARMMKAKLAASFNTWRIVTDYLLRLFEKSMKRWRNQALSAAFNTWWEKCQKPAIPVHDGNFSVPHFAEPEDTTVLVDKDNCLVSQYYPLCSPTCHITMNSYARGTYVGKSYPHAALNL